MWARWQDGGGVGLAAARAAREGGRPASGQLDQACRVGGDVVWHGLMADEERMEMAGAEWKETPSMESADADLGDAMPRWRRVNGAARGGGGLAGAGEQDETSPENKRR